MWVGARVGVKIDGECPLLLTQVREGTLEGREWLAWKLGVAKVAWSLGMLAGNWMLVSKN